MDLTVTEAAQLSHGEVKGHKRADRWAIPAESLPLTASQQKALRARVEQAREALESALPSRLARTRGDKRWSVADLDAFRAGREVLLAMRAAERGTSTRLATA